MLEHREHLAAQEPLEKRHDVDCYTLDTNALK